jgi:hypothetical protein
MLIRDIAFARSGDKGDVVNVGVLALDDKAYQRLIKTLTPERLKRHFGDWVKGEVGGATKTLRYDVTGKAFSTSLLRMEVAE